MQLVTDLIALLAAKQSPDCAVNTHIIAHSMAPMWCAKPSTMPTMHALKNNCWMISQLCLIADDISSSLREGHAYSESLYRHCTRLTNYFSFADSALKLSNVKRAGIAARAGRVGLPGSAPAKAVDVDCTHYDLALLADPALQAHDQPKGFLGNRNHSWFIGNRLFSLDLLETLKGDLDHRILPTRKQVSGLRRLHLVSSRT